MQDENNNSPENNYPNFRPPARPLPRENFIGGEIRQRSLNRPNYSPNPHNQENAYIAPNAPVTNIPTQAQQPSPSRPLYAEPTDHDNIDDLFPIQPTQQVINYEAKIKETVQNKKIPRLPKGVYLIVIVSLISLGVSFLNSANTHYIYSALMIIDFVAALGLLLKKKVARQALLVTSLLTILVSLVLIDVFWLTSNNVNKTFGKNYNEIRLHSTQQLPYSQKQVLASSQAKTIKQKNNIARSEVLFYAYTSTMVVESILVLLYLYRGYPKSFYIEPANQPKPANELLPDNTEYS